MANRDLVKRYLVVPYPGERDERQHGHCSEHYGGNQHDHSWAHVGAEEGDGCQPTAGQQNRKRREAWESRLHIIQPNDGATFDTTCISLIFAIFNGYYLLFIHITRTHTRTHTHTHIHIMIWQRLVLFNIYWSWRATTMFSLYPTTSLQHKFHSSLHY